MQLTYRSMLVQVSASLKFFYRFVKCYGAVVKYRTRNREVAGLIPRRTKCRVLKKDDLFT